MKEAIIKRLVLERDNHCCRSCGTKDNLEAHHIISKEEQALIGIDRELRKLLDQPDYRITLCVDCHSTTFFSSALPHLLTPDEKDELRDINKRTRELSERRKELKKKYENQWNTVSYQSQKHIIDKTFEELNRRRKEIRENGRIRLNNRRQEVIRLCDDQLLRVVDPNLFED